MSKRVREQLLERDWAPLTSHDVVRTAIIQGFKVFKARRLCVSLDSRLESQKKKREEVSRRTWSEL